MNARTSASCSTAFHVGVQYALAVGAASAAVGIVVGVINTTGVAFRLGFMVTNGARDMADGPAPVASAGYPWKSFAQASIQQFLSLVLIAIACILMGAGLPTTALYIMLVSVAQPALAQMGIPALATHMFVLYYGVISEITPPVCASAYAAAGIAGSNPFLDRRQRLHPGHRQADGAHGLRLRAGMLIVLPDYFTWTSFIQVSVTCAVGVFAIATAVAGYFMAPLNALSRFVMVCAGLLLVAPSWESDIAALVVAAPVVLVQLLARRRASAAD